MQNMPKPRWLIEVIAVWGYVQRNFFLTKRYFMWELVWLTFTTVNAMSITFIGAGAGELAGAAEALRQRTGLFNAAVASFHGPVVEALRSGGLGGTFDDGASRGRSLPLTEVLAHANA